MAKRPPKFSRKRRYTDNRPAIYSREKYGDKWKRIRDRFLKLHPVCMSDGCNNNSTVVDHIYGVEFGHKNMQALCAMCHNKKTARERVLTNSIT